MEPSGIHEKSFNMITFLQNLRKQASFLVMTLAVSACGLQPGVATCKSVAPPNGILSYQGSFVQANASGITGIVKTYISNGLIYLVVENLTVPSGAALSLTLETQSYPVFYLITVRANECAQLFPTSRGLVGGDRFTQATLRTNNSPMSPLQATALLSSVLPNSLTLTY